MNSSITTLLLATCCWCGYMTSAVGAESAKRLTNTINWDEANREKEQAQSAGKAEGLRSAKIDKEADAIALPVLVPSQSGPVRAAPNLQHQVSSYAAVYLLTKAKLTVAGANSRIVGLKFPGLDNVEGTYQFQPSEDGADLSLSRFGASYTLRLSCQEPEDERCTKPAFLQGVAASLVPIGGKSR